MASKMARHAFVSAPLHEEYSVNSTVKTVVFWLVIVLAGVLLWQVVKGANSGAKEREIIYSEFMSQVDKDNISEVTVVGNDVHGKLKSDKSSFHVFVPSNYTEMYKPMRDHGVNITVKDANGGSYTWLINLLPFVLLGALWFIMIRQMQTGGNKALSFGKSRARLLSMQQKKITFKDVAGVDEAKEELKEIIEFLREAQKFQKLGGRIPKGVLLVGPPGTGKTLLARAVAGEANVPFFSISGSDFVEMFVGVGASRVRDLVEMDGFESNDGVILIAATNRPDVLDPALLRPGRFDRRVVVTLADVRGREEILRVHTRKIPISDDVDLSVLARGTPGFSGADLANMVNEAALCAARQKRITAYHEGGHALVAAIREHSDPLHKVTIIPRGMALGLTMQLPIDDKHTYRREYLETRLAILMGGRVAEELFLNSMTTGAGNDIERASDLARKMVCEFGMSSMGPITFGKKEEQIFLGREISQHRDFSEETARSIDAEVRRFVNEGYESATSILSSHRDALERIAQALLEREVLDAGEVTMLIAGTELPVRVNPNAPGPKDKDEVQQVLKPAPGQGNAAQGERPAQA